MRTDVSGAQALHAVFETRRANLRLLAESQGGIGVLAAKLDHANSSYLSQLVGPNPTRQVSERVARGIEGKLGLTAGWLDAVRSAG